MQMAEAFAVRKTDDKNTDNKTWKLPPAGPNAGRRCFSWAAPAAREGTYGISSKLRSRGRS